MKPKIKRTLFQFFTVLPITLILSYFKIYPFSLFNKGINLMALLATGILFLLVDILYSFLIKKGIFRK